MGTHYNPYTKKYICISCKKEVDEVPPMKHNECPTGYCHYFILTSILSKYVIPHNKREGYGYLSSEED